MKRHSHDGRTQQDSPERTHRNYLRRGSSSHGGINELLVQKRPLPEDLFSLEEDRHGGGFVFDCRSLPNPGREDAYKSQTGLDQDVIDYLERSPEVRKFSVHINELISIAVSNFLERGFSLMVIGFGCTGGQHRSVFFCERTAAYLRQAFPETVITKVCHHNLLEMGMIPPPSSEGAAE